jgi:hypothetical protein
LESLDIWEFLGTDEESHVTLGALREAVGNATLYEVAILALLSKMCGFEQVFEIGTYDGRTAYNIALNSKTIRVATLNLPPEELAGEWIHRERASVSGYRFHGSSVEPRITEYFCDSRAFADPGPQAGCDFVFIDGDHSSEMVDNDLELGLRLLKARGPTAIALHDCNFGSVQLGIHVFTNRHMWRKPYIIERTNLGVLFLVDRIPCSAADFFFPTETNPSAAEGNGAEGQRKPSLKRRRFPSVHH